MLVLNLKNLKSFKLSKSGIETIENNAFLLQQQ